MADKEADLVHQYRFRVRTGSGQELVSEIATVKKPGLTAGLQPEAALAWAEVPVTKILIAAKGKQQGDFTPDPGFTDRPGTAAHQFSTEEFYFAVSTPRDPQSGLPSGQRVHVPVTFLKTNGPSTPQFYQALCNNESLPAVVFDCYGLDQQGQLRLAHSVRLTNASVSTVEFRKPDLRDPAKQKYDECTKISLTFQKIEVAHGSVVTDDDWEHA